MFCNKCGKTLNPEAKTCPSCGQTVGDSRFEGSGYTSSQIRFVPESAERQGYAPYTKTTYSSTPDEGGDVYSRTSYRPALAQDEGGQTTGLADAEPEPQQPEEGERPEGGEQPEEGTAPEPQPEARPPQPEPYRRAAPDDRDALGIEIKPLEPIRKAGISPEVQRYIQQMNQKKGRVQRKAHPAPDGAEPQEGEPRDEGAGREQAEDEQDAAPARPGPARWALRIGGVLAVLALLVAGVIFIAVRTANHSKIPGVTYTLYTEGLSMVKQRVTDEYRAEIVLLWRADQSGKAALQQQAGEGEQIKKLLPEKPMENDPLFIDTLLAVQKSIDEATTTDAYAALGAGNNGLGLLSQESERNWKHINDKIAELEAVTTAEQLTAIRDGVPLETIATPTPVPTATPSPYKTLKKGMKNNRQVKNLQDRLHSLGWFNGVRDGDFGPATQTAVKKFQRALGVAEDGIATSELQARLYAADAPRGDGKQSVAAPTTAAETPAPEGGEAPAA